MPWTATNSEGYPAPAALATDVVVLTARNGGLMTLTTTREDGSRALPGGFVGPSERPQDTALRKLHEKTGLGKPYVEQLGAFADPGRDPRGWIPSIAYLALVPPDTEAPDPTAHWIAARGAGSQLAFDHRAILQAAVERLEGKLWWSNITVGILPGSFALSDARRVYESIASTRYDPATFARDLKATGLIEATGEQRADGPGRPAALYRFSSRQPVWGAGRRKRIAVA
ncbi:MAG: 8-oxo-dGTP diphosphatase [Solirubrobacteraceae bacterium]|nr:8-oxo-dGTP diphosphatase [Solirubrobacteraceae bacterium]MEA2185801.1 8-oxo-dGTP diphosphatase [Solirubrobacteraceae bacterium]